MQRDVYLEMLDGVTLRELFEVAVADAAPEEVMPPVEGPGGWTPRRREAFLAFFGPMLTSAEITIFAIRVDGEMAGFIRLARTGAAGVAETGMWLGRSWRGKGIGGAALNRLLDEAREAGFTRVVADTTPANRAARAALRRAGAHIRTESDKIYAEIIIDPAYTREADK